jgi:hypothetical protein
MSRTRRKIPEGKFYRTARCNGGNNGNNNNNDGNNNQPRRCAISGRRERMRATMKPISVEYQGKPDPGWAIGTFKDAWNVGGNLPKDRRISGWQLRSPDGVIRMREGNWEQFVPFANEVLSNYGCSTRIS